MTITILLPILIGTLISIIGFFAILYINKLIKIQQNLHTNQLQLVKIREKMLTRQEVKEMIKDEIAYYHVDVRRG